jgi:hypothetical protein
MPVLCVYHHIGTRFDQEPDLGPLHQILESGSDHKVWMRVDPDPQN